MAAMEMWEKQAFSQEIYREIRDGTNYMAHTSAKLCRSARNFPSSLPAYTNFCLIVSEAVFLYEKIKNKILKIKKVNHYACETTP